MTIHLGDQPMYLRKNIKRYSQNDRHGLRLGLYSSIYLRKEILDDRRERR